MIREILVWPHPTLKKKAEFVDRFDKDLADLVDDMFETMYASRGVGLAAPQIGVLKNIIVLDTTGDKTQQLVMINPRVLNTLGTVTYNEGCLSVPGASGEITRSALCWIEYMDQNAVKHTRKCEGLLAIAVQHELDHLDGVVFVDHLSQIKRDTIKKKLKKLK
jgi:peptide deformylase